MTFLHAPLLRPSFCGVRFTQRRPLRYNAPRTYKFEEQETSDTSPTSYGEIETIGSTAGSATGSGRERYDNDDDDIDRPLESLKDSGHKAGRKAEEVGDEASRKAEETGNKAGQKFEEAKEETGHKYEELKDDIKSTTGDLEEDLGQLNVEDLLENVADPKEFGKRGEPLFFGQLLLLTLVFFPPKFFTTLVSSLGLVSIIGGLFFAVLGVRDMGSNFYPFTAARKGNKLVTQGLFKYVRHPIYCGLGFLSFGLCAITGSQARLALSVTLWIVLNHMANVEEAEMDSLHDEQWSEYSSRVSKLIPGIF